MAMDHRDRALVKLCELGAHDLQHLNGDLAEHLKGTYALLHRWGNPEPVCLAGLFHAVYGTSAFPAQLLSLDKRSDVSAVIGDEAERIVYVYGACDRDYTYSRITSAEEPTYRDRFTQETRTLPLSLLTAFCELTVANELNIVCQSDERHEDLRAFCEWLFPSFENLISAPAFQAYLTALDVASSST